MTLTPQEILIRDLEFKLEKARYGMGMPYSIEDVLHYEALLADAKRAQPDDPGVLLAAKLIAAE